MGCVMQKIKVIEYIHGMEDGGAETLVKDYALLLNREKFDFVIVLNRIYKNSANLQAVRETKVPIITIYSRWNVFIKVWHETMGWWYVPYKLRKILKKERAQILHVHLGLLRYVNRIGKALNGIKLFYTCHSIPQRYLGKNIPKEHRAAKQLLKQHELQIIALHSKMAEEINELFGINNTVVIRNGIDFKRFLNVEISKEDKRKALGIPLDAFVIGHVGRFNPVKNHKFLVEVFREVAIIRPNAFLLMIGAGSATDIENTLDEYGLGDRYLILANRSDVHEIMRTMDVFVFPSILEGFGNALIEAQVSGLKCVASDTIPKEVFRTNKAIPLPLENPKHWAQMILDDESHGEQNETLYEYDMNNAILELEKLYINKINC